ncbi:MAG: cation diffusion facilitator family transporter, partial [Acidimicrobiales bacterium]
MSADGGPRAIVAALAANAGIAVAKLVGFLVTGSSSMLAEAVHYLADTANQGLLLLGRRTSTRRATGRHPFGHGRERYFYAFVVALLLFTLGSVFALYEGIHKLEAPEPLSSPLVAVVILVVAIGLEGYSFRTAIHESRPLKGTGSWWDFIRQSKVPELRLVLLEDFGVPVPGETVLIAAAIYAGAGRLNIVVVAILAFAAAIIGDNIGYAIGHFGGRELVLRWGKYVFLTAARLDKAQDFFAHHGGKVVTVARFIEGLRQANGIIAGISEMPWRRFLVFNCLGAALWVGLWTAVGYV